MTFANLCKVLTVKTSCWIAAILHSTSDVLTIVLARRTSQIHPEIQNTHSLEAEVQYWKGAQNFGKLPCSNDAFEWSCPLLCFLAPLIAHSRLQVLYPFASVAIKLTLVYWCLAFHLNLIYPTQFFFINIYILFLFPTSQQIFKRTCS